MLSAIHVGAYVCINIIGESLIQQYFPNLPNHQLISRYMVYRHSSSHADLDLMEVECEGGGSGV